MSWEHAIEQESLYWDRFASEIGTFQYQEMYMEVLDIYKDYNCKFGSHHLDLDFRQKNILDVGGGPVSILLRANGGDKREIYPETNNWSNSGQVKTMSDGVVIDPLRVPNYVKERYQYFGINFINEPAENIDNFYNEEGYFDECIIYNCLQHVKDPIEILDKVSKISKQIRICEPINIPTDEMHLWKFGNDYFEKYFDESRFECVKSGFCQIGVDHFVGIYKIKN